MKFEPLVYREDPIEKSVDELQRICSIDGDVGIRGEKDGEDCSMSRLIQVSNVLGVPLHELKIVQHQ